MKHLTQAQKTIFLTLVVIFGGGILISFFPTEAVNHSLDLASEEMGNGFVLLQMWVRHNPFMAVGVIPLFIFIVAAWQARKARRYF